MKISREIKTAILVLGAIVLFIWGYSFLKGNNLFDNSQKYYVEYQNVEGLTTSSVVTINGLTVGKVSKITIDQTTGKLVVEILMTNPIKISKESTATIYSPGLIAAKAISIDPLFGQDNYAENGAYLKGDVQKDMSEQLMTEMLPLKAKVEGVLESTSQMLSAINGVFDETMQQDLKQAASELKGTLAASKTMLNVVQPKLAATLDNLNTMSGEFVEVSQKLNKLDIQSTFNNLNSATASMDKLLASLEDGNGSIGMLLKDPALYANLTNASKELEQLLRDLKENPKRYMHFSVFGKKAVPYQEQIEVELQEQDVQ